MHCPQIGAAALLRLRGPEFFQAAQRMPITYLLDIMHLSESK
jgi:hypothetical protein